MEGVVKGRVVIVGHVEAHRLTLDAIADIVNQALRQDVVVDRRQCRHQTTQQEKTHKNTYIYSGEMQVV